MEHALGSLRHASDARIFFGCMAAEMQVEILWNCVTTKENRWRHQKETRLLALNRQRKPRLEIHNADKRPRVEINQPLLKANLAEVMVGAHADANVEDKVRAFLREHGLAEVPVSRTYRGSDSRQVITSRCKETMTLPEDTLKEYARKVQSVREPASDQWWYSDRCWELRGTRRMMSSSLNPRSIR